LVVVVLFYTLHKVLTTLKVKGDDQKAGVALVAKALQAPIRQITLNSWS